MTVGSTGPRTESDAFIATGAMLEAAGAAARAGEDVREKTGVGIDDADGGALGAAATARTPGTESRAIGKDDDESAGRRVVSSVSEISNCGSGASARSASTDASKYGTRGAGGT